MKKIDVKCEFSGVEESYLFFLYDNLNIYLYSNRIINQKYFYCDSNVCESFLIKTKEKINIYKKEKEELIKYLKEKDIDIKYFENFEGHIFLFRSQWVDHGLYVKNIYIYFFNLLFEKDVDKFFIINVKKERDIAFILVILNYYLYTVKQVNINNNYFKFFFLEDLYTNAYVNIIPYFDCYKLIEYFFNYANLLMYLNQVLLLNKDSLKDFIYLQISEHMDINNYEEHFMCDQLTYKLYKINKEFFNNFKGSVFLMEFYIIEKDNKKFKKYVLIFLNELNWKWRVFYLSDLINLDFVLLILKMPWIEDNYLLDETQKNMVRNFVKTNTSLYKNNDEYFLNIEIANVIDVKNKEELIYYIEHYKLFL